MQEFTDLTFPPIGEVKEMVMGKIMVKESGRNVDLVEKKLY